jgi:hypothetical protein
MGLGNDRLGSFRIGDRKADKYTVCSPTTFRLWFQLQNPLILRPFQMKIFEGSIIRGVPVGSYCDYRRSYGDSLGVGLPKTQKLPGRKGSQTSFFQRLNDPVLVGRQVQLYCGRCQNFGLFDEIVFPTESRFYDSAIELVIETIRDQLRYRYLLRGQQCHRVGLENDDVRQSGLDNRVLKHIHYLLEVDRSFVGSTIDFK